MVVCHTEGAAQMTLFDALALTLLLGYGDTFAGTRPIPAAVVNPDAVHGFLYQPAYSIDRHPRLPAVGYVPEPGDVFLLSDPTPLFTTLYLIAGTYKPGHSAIVIRLPDGQLGLFEAGWNSTAWTRVSPLEWRLNEYPGTVWVRKRKCPLTPEQSDRLTAFALSSADKRYNNAKFALQITPFRCRGPLRTFFIGKPVGPGKRYFCAQAIIESLVYAGLIDARTARPAVVYPRDLFFDRSPNLYLRLHPPIAEGWEVPALWTRCPAGACCGPFVTMPYTAFPRMGVYVPPPELVSPIPAKPNPR
jgi:hypothetical protein